MISLSRRFYIFLLTSFELSKLKLVNFKLLSLDDLFLPVNSFQILDLSFLLHLNDFHKLCSRYLKFLELILRVEDLIRYCEPCLFFLLYLPKGLHHDLP